MRGSFSYAYLGFVVTEYGICTLTFSLYMAFYRALEGRPGPLECLKSSHHFSRENRNIFQPWGGGGAAFAVVAPGGARIRITIALNREFGTLLYRHVSWDGGGST